MQGIKYGNPNARHQVWQFGEEKSWTNEVDEFQAYHTIPKSVRTIIMNNLFGKDEIFYHNY